MMRQMAPSPSASIRHRIALAREPQPVEARRPRLGLLAAEASWLAQPLLRPFRPLTIEPAATPRTVVLFPGFCAHPLHLRTLRQRIAAAGHRVHCWGQGVNTGATADLLDRLDARLAAIEIEYREPVVLVGWSLGGIFAREVAKRQPNRVSKVITMGSPFSGHPRANNAWRLYHLVTGHRVEEPPIEATVSVKPPVETVALWSPRDGIVHPRAACGRAGERDRAVALRCTHMGFVHSPEGVKAVLRELDRD